MTEFDKKAMFMPRAIQAAYILIETLNDKSIEGNFRDLEDALEALQSDVAVRGIPEWARDMIRDVAREMIEPPCPDNNYRWCMRERGAVKITATGAGS